MGEDFLRRRSDRFVRRRDAQFAEELGPDLLSACTPNVSVGVCGTALGHVRLGSELWAPAIGPSGPIQFYEGASPAVRLDGPPAEHVRRGFAGGAPVVAK